MKKSAVLILSLLVSFVSAKASEVTNKKVTEKTLFETLSDKGLVSSQETASSGRTTGGGPCASISQ